MDTVLKTLQITPKNAYIARNCLDSLIAEGYGNDLLFAYEGSPDIFSKRLSLNKHLVTLSAAKLYPKKILVGARCNYGYKVYIVLTRDDKNVDVCIYSLRDKKTSRVTFKNQYDISPKKLLVRILKKIPNVELDAKLTLIETNIELIEDVLLINDVLNKRINNITIDKIIEHLEPIPTIKELSNQIHKSALLNQILRHQMQLGRGDLFMDCVKAPMGKRFGNIPSYAKIAMSYPPKGYEVVEHIEGTLIRGGYKWLYLILRKRS